jgi:RES domain-containing protein
MRYSAFEIEFEESLLENMTLADMQEGWDGSPPGISMRVGAQWLREQRSAVLGVPSAVLPLDRNFVLNPRHPDFGKIRIAEPISFAFDSRLINR